VEDVRCGGHEYRMWTYVVEKARTRWEDSGEG
jgi:hypothetical protein